MTFGDLAIGDTFEWLGGWQPPKGRPRRPPITKVDDQHYEFLIHGTGPLTARGTAEPQYPVRRIRRKDLEQL